MGRWVGGWVDRNKPVRHETTSDKTPRRLVAHGVGKKAFTHPLPRISQAPGRRSTTTMAAISTAARPRGTPAVRTEAAADPALETTPHSTCSSLVCSKLQSDSAMVITPHVSNGRDAGRNHGPVQPVITRKANCALGVHQLPRMLLLLLIKSNPGHHQNTHRLGSRKPQALTRN